MDSNSEGSFAWTDASEDTSDSEIMNKSDSSPEQSGEESGKYFKANLQKQLFANGDSDHTNGHSRKRKLSDRSVENDKITNNKKIKVEPESDLDSKNMKRKRSSSNYSNTSVDVDPYHESFLEQKVKHEQNSAAPTPVKHKKKKTKVDSITEHGDHLSDIHLHYKDSFASLDGEESPDKTRKCKTKRNKSKSHTMEPESGDLSNCPLRDDSVNEKPSARHTSLPGRDDTPPKDFLKKSKRRTESEKRTPSLNGTLEPTGNSKRKSKLSDRIMFENDSNDEAPARSERLAAFVRAAPARRPLRGALAALPGADEELWLVACPGDVDAAAFLHRTWALDGRIKLEGRTYEGGALERRGVLCAAGGARPAVRALRLRGAVRLRRRPPRARLPPAAAEPPRPLPLPATRARHPLLGAHYRARLKLRPEVARRLRHPPPHDPPPHDPPPHDPPPPQRRDKKKRKRERARPSAETWDSERAIEETLFAF